MIHRKRENDANGVSPAWISFADFFSQLMFILIVICVLLFVRYKEEETKNTGLETEIGELQNQLEAVGNNTFIVSGQVDFPDDHPGTPLNFLINDKTIPVETDGRFVFRNLKSGAYEVTLTGKGYKDKYYKFDINAGGFSGYRVTPGKMILKESYPYSNAPEGLVIKEITDEYLEFGKGKFQITDKGRIFLINQFKKSSPEKISPYQRLQENPQLKIVVIGQADPDPVDDALGYSNVGLSALRASTVADFITTDLGIREDQVIVMGLGSASSWLPPRPSDLEFNKSEYYKKCRRVLIMYSENSEDTLLKKIRYSGSNVVY